jgi:hypothetical protein
MGNNRVTKNMPTNNKFPKNKSANDKMTTQMTTSSSETTTLPYFARELRQYMFYHTFDVRANLL